MPDLRIEIEDEESQPVFMNKRPAQPCEYSKPTISASLLGKRLQPQSSLEEHWTELLGDDDSAGSDLCIESIRGLSKRQRVNSATAKLEFCFKPTMPSRTASNPTETQASKKSCLATAITKMRDVKAAKKSSASQFFNFTPQQSEQRLPKIHVSFGAQKELDKGESAEDAPMKQSPGLEAPEEKMRPDHGQGLRGKEGMPPSQVKK